MELQKTDPRTVTREYFDSLLLEQRLVGAVEPDTETVIYGHRFATPIMTAAELAGKVNSKK